jgi:hypothetical protein
MESLNRCQSWLCYDAPDPHQNAPSYSLQIASIRAMEGTDQIRAAARAYLEAALPELDQRYESHHAYRYVDQPAWLSTLHTDEIAPAARDVLVDAIRVANPERFASKHAEVRRYATRYPPALLRALVARSRVAYVEPTADSEQANAVIEELAERVAAPIWSWRTLYAVADLDAEEVDGREVHGVRIRAVRRRGERWADWELAVSAELPEAVQMLVETDIYDVAGYESTTLLVVTDEREIPEHQYFRDPADGQLGRVLTALRVATGATIDVTASCRGEPFYVHQAPPVVRAGEWDSFGAWIRRPLRLAADQLHGIEQLAGTLAADVSESLNVALSRYSRSHNPGLPFDRIVDLAVAIEAALIGGGERDEITLRICSRAAHLLATEDDPASAIFDDVYDLYALRSTVVHGGTNADRRWQRFTERNGFSETLAVDRLTPAFDRLRDLVRRAILARLLLRADSLGGVLWRDRDAPVDRALVDPVEREAWRSAIRDRCDRLGVPDAWRRASPLRDLLAERRGADR